MCTKLAKLHAASFRAMAASSVKLEPLTGHDGDAPFTDWKQTVWTWFHEDSVAKDQNIGDVLLETWSLNPARFSEAWNVCLLCNNLQHVMPQAQDHVMVWTQLGGHMVHAGVDTVGVDMVWSYMCSRRAICHCATDPHINLANPSNNGEGIHALAAAAGIPCGSLLEVQPRVSMSNFHVHLSKLSFSPACKVSTNRAPCLFACFCDGSALSGDTIL